MAADDDEGEEEKGSQLADTTSRPATEYLDEDAVEELAAGV